MLGKIRSIVTDSALVQDNVNQGRRKPFGIGSGIKENVFLLAYYNPIY